MVSLCSLYPQESLKESILLSFPVLLPTFLSIPSFLPSFPFEIFSFLIQASRLLRSKGWPCIFDPVVPTSFLLRRQAWVPCPLLCGDENGGFQQAKRPSEPALQPLFFRSSILRQGLTG